MRRAHVMTLPFDPTTLRGKFCLVTDATAGIGKATALALATHGAEVIIAGRDQLKLESTHHWIQSQSGNEIPPWVCAEFSSLDQIRDLARTYKDRHPRLDVLINNAGSYYSSRQRTELGVERTLLVNHLAPFLLTNLLLDLMKQSAPSRIVNVSSEAYKYGKLNFKNLELKGLYFGMLAYARSKLANILFTYELARRVEGSQVTVNALHPGHVATAIWSEPFSYFGPLLKGVIGTFSISTEEAANNILSLACSSELDNLTGHYFVGIQKTISTPVTYDLKLAEQLWSVSAELCSIT